MATALKDSNIKKIIGEIPSKGFRTRFWREYRAGACKGSGVGKYMDLLEKLGLPPSGDPTKAPLDNMPDIIDGLTKLANAMLKASDKCGKLQSHSKEFCIGYRKRISKMTDIAEDLARNADKIKQREMAEQLRIERENAATDEHLDKLKRENEERKKLVRKELADLQTRAIKIDKACQTILSELTEARKQLGAIQKAWKTQHGKEGANRPEIEKRADAEFRNVFKSRRIEMHAKNIQSSLPKLIKEATTLFKQYAKVDGLQKERVATGKALKSAQDRFVAAQDDIKFFVSQYKQLLQEVQAARPEGV